MSGGRQTLSQVIPVAKRGNSERGQERQGENQIVSEMNRSSV